MKNRTMVRRKMIAGVCAASVIAGCGGRGTGASPIEEATAPPTFSLAAGSYTSVQSVSLSDATSGATIYYTTDGGAPTQSSSVYSAPIKVAATMTIQAFAIASGYNASSVAGATYTISMPTAATPAFSPAPGSFASAQTVTLADATAGALLYYTTDGSTPTASSAKYIDPIPIAATTAINAIAVAPGYENSSVATGIYTITAGSPSAVSVYLSTHDRQNLLAPEAKVNFTSTPAATLDDTIYVDETQKYQTVDGFGAAMTDSAAYLLNEVVPSGSLDRTMNALFTRSGDGIGISFIRNPMAGTDLARSVYSFDDQPVGSTDPDLIDFSIARDRKDIIPLLLQAKSLNPQMTIMANPWSPPGWMKDPNSMSPVSMLGGSLLAAPATETALANYFVKYIQAYKSAGIAINYLGLQNEPTNVTTSYPSMGMDDATETRIAARLRAAGVDISQPDDSGSCL